jgi:hypothetical protein
MRKMINAGGMPRHTPKGSMEQVGGALHDLCQPLTTLQCRLELAGLHGTPEAYREAVDLGLVECARLTEAVGSMRNLVYAAMSAAEKAESRAEG